MNAGIDFIILRPPCRTYRSVAAVLVAVFSVVSLALFTGSSHQAGGTNWSLPLASLPTPSTGGKRSGDDVVQICQRGNAHKLPNFFAPPGLSSLHYTGFPSNISQQCNLSRMSQVRTVVLGLEAPCKLQDSSECGEEDFAIPATEDVEPGEWMYGDGDFAAPTAWQSHRPVHERWGSTFRELFDASKHSQVSRRRRGQVRILIIGDSLIRVFLPVFAELVLEEVRQSSAAVADSPSLDDLRKHLAALPPSSVEAHDLETQDISMIWPRDRAAFLACPVQIVFFRAFLLDESFPFDDIRVPSFPLYGNTSDGEEPLVLFRPTHILTNRAHDYGVVKGWHDANVPVARIPSTLMRLRRAYRDSLIFFYGVVMAHKPMKKSSKYQVCERRLHIDRYRMAERYAVAMVNTAIKEIQVHESSGTASCRGRSARFFFISLNAMSRSVKNYRLCSRHGDGWHFQGRVIREMARCVLRHFTHASHAQLQGQTSRTSSGPSMPAQVVLTSTLRRPEEQLEGQKNKTVILFVPMLNSGEIDESQPWVRSVTCSVSSRRSFFASLVKCKPTSIDIQHTEQAVNAAAASHELLVRTISSEHLKTRLPLSHDSLSEQLVQLIGTEDRGSSDGPSALLPGVPKLLAFPPLSIVTQPFVDMFDRFVSSGLHPNQFPSPATCGAVISLFREVVGDLEEWIATNVRRDLWIGEEIREINGTTTSKSSRAVQNLLHCLRFVAGYNEVDNSLSRRRLFGIAVASLRLEHSFGCKRDLASWLLHAPDDDRRHLIEAVPADILKKGPERRRPAPQFLPVEDAVDLLGCNEQDSFDDKMIRRDLYWPMMQHTQAFHTLLRQRMNRTSEAHEVEWFRHEGKGTATLATRLLESATSCLEYIAHVARPGSDFSLSLRRFVLTKCVETIQAVELYRKTMPKKKPEDGKSDRALRHHQLHFPGHWSMDEGVWRSLLFSSVSKQAWSHKEALRTLMWNCTGRPMP